MHTNKQTKKVKVTRKRKWKHCLLNCVFNLFYSVLVLVLLYTSHIQLNCYVCFIFFFVFLDTLRPHRVFRIPWNSTARHLGELFWHWLIDFSHPCSYVGIFSSVTPRARPLQRVTVERREESSVWQDQQGSLISIRNQNFNACQLLLHF